MKELTEYPISSIEDGWVLRTGELYLFVRRDDGVIETVVLPRRQIGSK